MGVLKRPRTKTKKDVGPLSEARVQNLLAEMICHAHEMTVPNIGTLWQWESDLASVTKTDLSHDFEIKISRADWLAEKRKIEEAGGRNPKADRDHMLRYAKEIEAEEKNDKPRKTYVIPGKTRRMSKGAFYPPNYFWVVVPEGVVKDGELPDYAGLIEITFDERRGYRTVTRKKAPRLHGLKIADRQWRSMARGLSVRVWAERSRQSKQK